MFVASKLRKSFSTQLFSTKLTWVKLGKPSLRLSSTEATVELFEPGLAVVRNALSKPQQISLTQASCFLGLRDSPLGFFDENGEPNSRPYRGRVYSSINDWPSWVKKDVCDNPLDLARKKDHSLPLMDCTHVLLLCYMNSEGVGWHRDIYENDGEADKPIVTINLGNSCEFIFKDDHTTPKTFIKLNSGDCLLFGGSKRYAMHKVSQVFEHTCPSFLKDFFDSVLDVAKRRPSLKNYNDDILGTSGRLSLTFRDAPTVIGRENEFATFKVDEHFDKEANFKWNSKENSLVTSQPGQTILDTKVKK
jgi:hypothetical protein